MVLCLFLNKMARLLVPVVVRFFLKVTVISILTVVVFVNFKLTVLQGKHASSFNSTFLHGNYVNSTSTNENIFFMPRCFDSIQQLVNNLSDTRWRTRIICNKSTVTINKERVDQHQEPCQLNWKRDLKCLNTFIHNNCYYSRGQIVPNIVHYVSFGQKLFKAENFVSVLSAVRFQQPCAILFHCKEPPFGPYWTVLLSIVPNIILVQRDEPQTIFGKKFGFIQHKSDIVRLEVLNASGGIYLDTDQILVRGVDEFLKEPFVMSHENKNNLANSMIVAQPRAPFINLWYLQYQWYTPKKWGYHSTYVPWDLAKKHPKMIKVVQNKFVNPDLTNITQVFRGHYNIAHNYGLHLYTRFFPKLQLKLPEVTTWNTSLGNLWRTILFSSPEMFSCNSSIS